MAPRDFSLIVCLIVWLCPSVLWMWSLTTVSTLNTSDDLTMIWPLVPAMPDTNLPGRVPRPHFNTSSDLLGAIERCVLDPRQTHRCHIVHISKDGSIYLDEATPLPMVPTNRLMYIVRYLQSLSDLRLDANLTTLLFYTADHVPKQVEGYPIITHTTDRHDKHLLFPTPYLLRDIQSGHLQSVLRHCESGGKPSAWRQRSNTLYFRGKYRNDFRIQVAHYAMMRMMEQDFTRSKLATNTANSENSLAYDVKFTDSVPGNAELKRAKADPWLKKMQYKYLLTLPGDYSSQWEVYHDYIAGGVIVRYNLDKKEYWNYDVVDTHALVNFDAVEKIDQAIRHPFVQRCQEKMASFTKRVACERLQLGEIDRYSRQFLVEYANRFGNAVGLNETYHFKDTTWTPTLLDPTWNGTVLLSND